MPVPPAGWRVEIDTVKNMYYWTNIDTGEIQWTPPQGTNTYNP